MYTEFRQATEFESLEHAAQLSIIRTASILMDAFEQMLKPHGITATQFNVLRILRDAEPQGLCRYEIADRMVHRMPDVTRLLDRMEEAGTITRERSSEDRRMVRTVITPEGRTLLEAIDAEADAEQKRPFEDLTAEEVQSIIHLLARVRRSV